MAVYLRGRKLHIDVTPTVTVNLSPNVARKMAHRILRETMAIDEGKVKVGSQKVRKLTLAQRLAHALAGKMGGANGL